MEKIKALCAVMCGTVVTLIKGYYVSYLAVIIAIMLDLATGLIKARISEGGIDSGTARRGLFGKLALLAALTFGVFLDVFIPMTLADIGLESAVKLPFAMMTGAYIVINESISVCENLYAINPKALPSWIARILKTARKSIEKEDDENGKGDA